MGISLISKNDVASAVSKLGEKAMDQLDNRAAKSYSIKRQRLKQLNYRAAKKRAKRKGILPSEDLKAIRQMLNEKIIYEVKRKRIFHKDVADIAQVSRPRITAIMNRHLERVTTDCMIKILNILGMSITISVK